MTLARSHVRRLQAQKLHQISGLSREDAEKLLLERLDRELADEVAARIHKHEEQLKTITEEKARTTMLIPLFATMTDEEQTYVIDALHEELAAA